MTIPLFLFASVVLIVFGFFSCLFNRKSLGLSRLDFGGFCSAMEISPLYGTRDRIRTCDLRLRRALLYPAELLGHEVDYEGNFSAF